jgi:hypothetical protein
MTTDHVDDMIQFAGRVAAYLGDPGNPATQADLSLHLARVLGRSTVHWRLEMARAYLNPWRPISSAPRDGTDVLLVWHPPEPPGAKPAVVQARWKCRTHCHSARRRDCPNEPDCNMGWGHYAGEFSHWQPLPLPPAPAA